MSVKSYLLSAKSSSVNGRNAEAIRPAPLFNALAAMEGVAIMHADLPDLWNVRITDEALADVEVLAKGWDLYPAPGQVSAGLRGGLDKAPAWLENPPEWPYKEIKPSGRPSPF